MKNHILFSHRNWKQELRTETEKREKLERSFTSEQKNNFSDKEQIRKDLQNEITRAIQAETKTEKTFIDNFMDNFENTVKKLKTAYDFCNITISNTPPHIPPTTTCIQIDSVGKNIYFGVGKRWFRCAMEEHMKLPTEE